MKIEVTARHFEAPVALKRHAVEEVSRLSKFYDGIVDCHIILNREGNKEEAEVRVGVYGKNLVARETTNDMAKSVDGAVEKLRRQLKRYKRKLRGFSPQETVRH